MHPMLSTRRMAAILAVIVSLAVNVPSCLADASGVIATVNGQAITDADVRKAAAEQFAALEHEYRRQVHDLVESQLQQLLRDRMLAAEAKARNLSEEQILAGLAPAAVTDADVNAFYEQNKAQIPRAKEDVADQIKAYLSELRQAETRDTFFKELESKYKVNNLLEPLRTDVAASGPSRGPAGAPVTLVVFSDFECPFCLRVLPTLEQVRAKYGDKVRIVFRQFPLDIHRHARKAAEAALCANEQGKFWEMHDAMFKDQKHLEVSDLEAAATRLEMNAQQFHSCLDSGKFAGQVETDVKEGTAAGVNGTPATFINGRFVNGAVPIEDFTKVLDDELRRLGASGAK